MINQIEWKEIEKYEGIYRVSNLGKIESLEKQDEASIKKTKTLKPALTGKGQYTVNLYKNNKVRAVIMKRVVWEAFKHKLEKKQIIRNIDGNYKNNRLDNLELISCRQHSTDTAKIKKKKKTSKYTGVSSIGHRWRAQINLNGKVKHLGYRDTEEECAELYQKALQSIENDLLHK